MYLKKVVLQRLNGILVVFARIPHGFWFNFFFSVSIKKVLQLKKANYFWSNTGALIFNYRTKKRFLVNFGKEFFFFFLLDLNMRETIHLQSWSSQSTPCIWKVLCSFPITWETCGQVLHQCFLGDRFSCRVHCWDGQAKDFPEWNKLRLTDGRHTDWWYITCRKTIFKWAVH